MRWYLPLRMQAASAGSPRRSAASSRPCSSRTGCPAEWVHHATVTLTAKACGSRFGPGGISRTGGAARTSATTKTSWDADNNVTYLEEANGAKTAYCYGPKTGYPLGQWDVETTKSWTSFNSTDCCTPSNHPADSSAYEYQTRADGYAADLYRKTSPGAYPAVRVRLVRRSDVGHGLEGLRDHLG